MSQCGENLLEVGNLRVSYYIRSELSHQAIRDLTFRISEGQAVGVFGESGSGKSTLTLAIGGLLPPNAHIEAGFISFRSNDLLRMPERKLEALRGADIGFILQEPAAALNPVLRIGDQIAEVVRAHHGGNDQQRRLAAQALLRQVHLPDSDSFFRRYPHEISGGQRQRVAIAQALAGRPSLLVADEPTTALDAITQAEILALLKELKQRLGLSILMIAHSPATLAQLVERIMVMHEGQIVEEGEFLEVCRRPLHAYTRRLLEVADTSNPETDRASWARQVGLADVACTNREGFPGLLAARDVSKRYRIRGHNGTRDRTIRALTEVNLTIRSGSIVGLVGESGCGKSTLARCLAGLERPDTGEVLYEGGDLWRLRPEQFRHERRFVQLVFQDSVMALNPSLTLEEIITEPLRIAGVGRSRQHERVRVLMNQVGLPAAWLKRRPVELSGGQRQRVAIARAMAADAKLIVLDEAFSGMDLPMQAQILRLLMALKDQSGVAFLFISHDISLAARITDEIAVMHNGQIVENADTKAILSAPQHPYTRSLLAAVPRWTYDITPPTTGSF